MGEASATLKQLSNFIATIKNNRTKNNQLAADLCLLCRQTLTMHDFCPDCRAHFHPAPPVALSTVCPIYAAFEYRWPLNTLIHAYKFHRQIQWAAPFARLMHQALGQRESPDALIPIPLHPKRFQQRGFNQTTELAKPLAQLRKLTVSDKLLIRQHGHDGQIHRSATERAQYVRHAFTCRAALNGGFFVLIDDVVTTGATLNEAAQTLLQHGATRVEAWVFARPSSFFLDQVFDRP